jgi:hypothetical protein
VHNDSIVDAIWPLIANKEAIRVNQAYQGHSGSPFAQSERTVVLTEAAGAKPIAVASSQYYYKPVSATETAVLLMNHDTAAQDLTLDFSSIPSVTCTKCKVHCIWMHKDIGTFEGSYTAKAVGGHDAMFFLITPA